MTKLILLISVVLCNNLLMAQNIFFEDFSSFNLAKIDGQGGWSSATPSQGNGTGACAGVGCLPVTVVSKSMIFPYFGSSNQAINPVDGVLATGDGPGKSLGGAITNGSVYVALLINLNSPLANPTGAKQIIRLMDNSFTTATRLYTKMATGGGAFLVGVDKNGGAVAYSSSSFSYGQDHLIILKYKFNTITGSDDVAAVFVDPDLTLPEPSPEVSAGGTDATTISRIAFPWNATFLPNGHIGIVSTSKDWTNIVPSSSPTYGVSGNIISPLKKAIQTSKIKLTTTSSKDSVLSTTNGSYTFSNLSTNDYTLRPTKNNDIGKANGVTSVDALLIQRHILNTTKLNSAYKLIAADVNGDTIINSVDVLRIKRLILATDTTFTSIKKGNRLWAFIDSAYIFPDTTKPFSFKDSISFTNLNSNKTNQTFIGVKLGDVNYDWNAAVARQLMVNSQQSIENSLLLIASVENTYSVQNPISVKVTTANFKDLAAMQYTLHFDNSKYEFVRIENNKINIDFNSSKANETGNIAMLWTDKKGDAITLEDGSLLFEMVLKPKQGIGNWGLGIGNLELGIGNTTSDSKLPFTSDSKLRTGIRYSEFGIGNTTSDSKLPLTNDLKPSTGIWYSEFGIGNTTSDSKLPLTSDSKPSTGIWYSEFGIGNTTSDSKLPLTSDSKLPLTSDLKLPFTSDSKLTLTSDLKLPLTTNLKLTLTNDITNIEAWDKDFIQHNIVLKTKTTQQQPEIPNSKQWFSIFPNPAKDMVYISCVDAKQILITDYLGRKKAYYNSKNDNINPLKVNIQHYSKGLYIVQFIMQDGTIKNGKLVVE